jgi:hypothetical protein
MADEHDSSSPIGRTADKSMKMLEGFFGQGSGRLVEYEDPALRIVVLKSTGDRDGGAIRGRQLSDHGVRVDVEAEFGEHLPNPFPLGMPVDHPRETPGAELPDSDVFQHREAVQKAEVLVDNRDAEASKFVRICR